MKKISKNSRKLVTSIEIIRHMEPLRNVHGGLITDTDPTSGTSSGPRPATTGCPTTPTVRSLCVYSECFCPPLM